MPNFTASMLHFDGLLMANPVLPSLLAVQDTLERHPDARAAFLQSEIVHREREIVLLRSHRSLLHVQIWNSIQTALIAGVLVFTLGVAFLGFVEFAKTLDRVELWNSSVSSSFVGRGLNLDFKSLIPNSPWFDKAALLPSWSVKQTTIVSLLVVLTFLIFQILQSTLNWRDSRRLRLGIEQCEDELKQLRSWVK